MESKSYFDKSRQQWYVYWLDENKKQHSTTYSSWRYKQIHGEVPEGFRVIYLDGNKLNISDDNLGLASEAEIAQIISKKRKGWIPSDETKERMSISAHAKILSEEHRAKIGKSVQQRWAEGEFDFMRKPKVEKVKTKRVYLKGIPMSEETKRKISMTLRGRIFSEEHRENLSKAGRGRFSGSKSKFWKGGVSKQIYPEEFDEKLKRKVRKKFGWKCQICGRKGRGRECQVHHIDGNKQNCAEDNFTILCLNCHNQVHGRSKNWIGEKVTYYQSLLKYDENGQRED